MAATRPAAFDFDLGRLHHIGVVVDDIDGAVDHFEQTYGLPVALGGESEYRCLIDGAECATVQRLGMTLQGPPHVELLRTVPGSEVWRPAPGVHHLGFVVDDLASASAELERRGVSLWMSGGHDRRAPSGTAYHRDTFGLTIELLSPQVERGLATRILGR